MTIEQRTFVELSDLIAAEFTCPGCGLKQTYQLGKLSEIPQQCPNGECNKLWFKLTIEDDDPFKALGAMFSQLQDIQKLLREGNPNIVARIRLQLK